MDNDQKFVDEANLMTYSGMGLDKRFSFILFADPGVCEGLIKRNNVLIYPYQPPAKEFYSIYKYARSLEFVKSNEKILLQYDKIIKTDTDVFFTDYMNARSFDDNIYIGRGQYLFNEESVTQVSSLAKKYGYSYTRKSDMHSTIIGPSQDVLDVMQKSDELCEKIFYDLCPSGDYGLQIADNWGTRAYSGTSSMIATEIVLSSLFYEKTIIDSRLDGDSFSIHQDISQVDHIHQWHGEGIFSKFDAAIGLYDSYTAPSGNTISEYCLRTYLEFRL